VEGPDRKILAITESQILFRVPRVASVSVGLSAGLKHFSLSERAKIGASAKKRKMPPAGRKTRGNACYAGYFS